MKTSRTVLNILTAVALAWGWTTVVWLTPDLSRRASGYQVEAASPGSEGVGPEPGAPARADAPLGTAFTYQGLLRKNGAPVSNVCSFTFALFDAPSGGTQIGASSHAPATTVRNGSFSADVDFGLAAFPGAARWVETTVQCQGELAATTLSPRTAVLSSPNALYSATSASAAALQGRSVSAAAPGVNQVLKWTGAQWAAGDDANSGGDITAVNAGPGLKGGGASGAVTLSADLASNGVTTTVARGDHTHWGQTWKGIDFGLTLVATRTNFANSTVFHGLASGADGTGVLGVVAAPGGDAWMVVPVGTAGISLVPAGGWDNRTYGVYGQAGGHGGYGVFGYGTYTGTAGTADPAAASGTGVYGEALGSGGTGVYGNGAATGVYGTGSTALSGLSTITNGNGLVAAANIGPAAYGVWGMSATGYAGMFSGKVHVNGALTKSGGSFKIDHPLDPANKYLYHSFVESPDMKNIYDGVAVLDAKGEAVITLPAYFGALNRDFRYQLTCIGGYAPVYVAEEIKDNQFTIAGGKPGLKVSWQVTGIRQDAWANDHRIPVEEAKPAEEVGTYLYPRGFGQPDSASPDQARLQQVLNRGTLTATTPAAPSYETPWTTVRMGP